MASKEAVVQGAIMGAIMGAVMGYMSGGLPRWRPVARGVVVEPAHGGAVAFRAVMRERKRMSTCGDGFHEDVSLGDDVFLCTVVFGNIYSDGQRFHLWQDIVAGTRPPYDTLYDRWPL